jgi:hypothetical protein
MKQECGGKKVGRCNRTDEKVISSALYEFKFRANITELSRSTGLVQLSLPVTQETVFRVQNFPVVPEMNVLKSSSKLREVSVEKQHSSMHGKLFAPTHGEEEKSAHKILIHKHMRRCRARERRGKFRRSLSSNHLHKVNFPLRHKVGWLGLEEYNSKVFIRSACNKLVAAAEAHNDCFIELEKAQRSEHKPEPEGEKKSNNRNEHIFGLQAPHS